MVLLLRRAAMLLVSILCILATAASAQLLPNGYPFVTLTITPSPDIVFSPLHIQTKIAEWVKLNRAADGFGALIVPTDITLGDMTAFDTPPIEISFGINAKKYVAMNGFMQEALGALTAGPIYTIFGADYTVNTVSFERNFPDSIAISFDPFGRQYVNSWTAELKMYLDFAPRPGTSVTVNLNQINLVCDPPLLTISYPNRMTTFKLFSSVVGSHATRTRTKTTNDPLTQYEFWVGNPTLQVDALALVSVTPPSVTIVNYNNTPSERYTVMVPSTYRDDTMRLVFTIKADPPDLKIYNSNISITKRAFAYYFYVIGTVGTYTLSYHVAPPWNTASRNNNYFTSSTTTHTVTYVNPLNITVGSIPDAYMVSTPIHSEYGGAYSRVINVYVQRAPKKQLIMKINAPQCEVFPSELVFNSWGPTMLQFYARGLVVGLRTFTFSLSGTSAPDFFTPAPKFWMVHRTNPICNTINQIDPCFEASGCQWNEDRGFCTNRTMPISIGYIPVLFDGEEGPEVNLTLSTTVRTQLKITFVANERLVFSPATLILPAGAKNATFRVTGYLHARDGITDQPFYLRLGGADANYFQQVQVSATVRPKIQCEIIKPMPFYVGTESLVFQVTCDGPPETEVFITPVPSRGIEYIPLGTFVGKAMYFDSQTSEGSFYAKSTNGVVGTFTVSMAISGVNAPRYEVIPVVTIRTLPLEQLNVLPPFHFTIYEGHPAMHIDLTATPTSPVYVSMQVVNKQGVDVGDNITLTPPTLMFNESSRNVVAVNGIWQGNYTILYNITGDTYRNYKLPGNSTFEAQTVQDGNAFTYRLKPGFQPKMACRISVGRNAFTFKGQDAIDIPQEFCATVPQLSADQSNGTTVCPTFLTYDRCRAALQRDGTMCAWFNDTCMYVPEMQGQLQDIAYGSGFTMFLTHGGIVYTLGKADFGQLGHFNEEWIDMVNLPENISAITAGVSSSFALSVTGRVYAWGANGKGQLGINKIVQQTESVYEISFPRYENISCISAGNLHAGAISLSGRLYMWGWNEFGQTANKDTYRSYQRAPVLVNREYFDGDAVTSIQCGEDHTMVATESAAYTFGNNNAGQLGRPGWDEWMPGQPLLWAQNRHVDEPSYASYIRGYGC